MLRSHLFRHRTLVFLCHILTVTSLTEAAQSTWTPQNGSSDLTDPNNWTPPGVPSVSDDAIFNSSIPGSKTPTDNTTAFSVSTLQFPVTAPYIFNINSQFLALFGAGITGSATNPVINAINTDNPAPLEFQIAAFGSSSSTGNATLNVTNIGHIPATANPAPDTSIIQEQQIVAGGTFSTSNANWLVQNSGYSQSAGSSSDRNVGVVNNSQVFLGNTSDIGQNSSITVSNYGNNTCTGDQQDFIGYVPGGQLVFVGAFTAGNGCSLEADNYGTDSSSGLGGHQTGVTDVTSFPGNQLEFDSTCQMGSNNSIKLTNYGNYSGTNTGAGASGCNVGQIAANQLSITGAFNAGSAFSLTATNQGIDSSPSGTGRDGVGNISGQQVTAQSSFTVTDSANITISNSANYSGNNSTTYVTVGCNVGQFVVTNDFVAGPSLDFTVSNDTTYAGTGSVNGNFVGSSNLNASQVNVRGNFSVGSAAQINITNNTTNLSTGSSGAHTIGSITGGPQLSVGSKFMAGDGLYMKATNTAYDNSTTEGSYVGSLISGSQVNIAGNCALGKNTTIDIENSGTYANTSSSVGNRTAIVGINQLLVSGQFSAGEGLNFKVSNTGVDSHSGVGSDAVATLGGSQVSFGTTAFSPFSTYGSATLQAINSGTYTGLNSSTVVQVGSVNNQFNFTSAFDASQSNNVTISATNTGIATSTTSRGSNLVGFVEAQIFFGSAASFADNAAISASNSGTSSLTSTNNRVGSVASSQIFITGAFSSGKNLNMSALNTSANTGNASNFVGEVSSDQVIFLDTCTMDDGSIISATNNGGTVSASQIAFNQGFSLLSGRATIQAITQGSIASGTHGIVVSGNSPGALVNIKLSQSALYVASTAPTFTIEELNGDVNSTVQSLPTLIINTDLPTNALFAGAIQNYTGSTSTLTKQGAGTQQLSGTNTFTGLTTIQEGTLLLTSTGSLAGNVNVGPSGILAGTGTIFGNVTNAGTISPGQSIGTLPIMGNFINNNADYNLEVDGSGNSDLILVGGTATLNGGTVYVSSVDGVYRFNTPYTILTAGSRVGTYTTATSSSLLNFTLSYDAAHVYLTIGANLLKVARGHNQIAVAERLDGIVHPNLYQSLMLSEIADLPAPEAREALITLSGYQHPDDMLISEIRNTQFIRKLYDSLREIVTAEPDCCVAYDDCCPTEWLEIEYGHSGIDGDVNANNFKFNTYEITGGIQRTFCNNLTGGLAASYEYDRVNYDNGGHADDQTALLGLYGLYRPHGFYGLLDVTGGYTVTRLHRAINAGTLHYTARSTPTIAQCTAYGELGVDWNVLNMLIQPFVGVEVGECWRQSVTEKEPHGWALAVSRKDWFTASSRLGVHFTAHVFCDTIELCVDMAWHRLLTGRRTSINGQFVEFGSEFAIYGSPRELNGFDYSVNLSSEVCHGMRGYIDVDGEAWPHAYTCNVSAGLEYNW